MTLGYPSLLLCCFACYVLQAFYTVAGEGEEHILGEPAIAHTKDAADFAEASILSHLSLIHI